MADELRPVRGQELVQQADDLLQRPVQVASVRMEDLLGPPLGEVPPLGMLFVDPFPEVCVLTRKTRVAATILVPHHVEMEMIEGEVRREHPWALAHVAHVLEQASRAQHRAHGSRSSVCTEIPPGAGEYRRFRYSITVRPVGPVMAS